MPPELPFTNGGKSSPFASKLASSPRGEALPHQGGGALRLAPCKDPPDRDPFRDYLQPPDGNRAWTVTLAVLA